MFPMVLRGERGMGRWLEEEDVSGQDGLIKRMHRILYWFCN